jgi:predicted DNA-binding protein
MEDHTMADSSDKTSQIHVRVPPEFKKALKIFCVREGTTEQAWISELIETELKSKAPDLWSQEVTKGRKSSKVSR